MVSLLLRRHFQSARQQSPHRRHRHIFHLRQIDIEAGTVLPPLLPYDDFSPPPSQFLDPAKIL
jgi:hypothetical protein